jgi:hypothetical protein
VEGVAPVMARAQDRLAATADWAAVAGRETQAAQLISPVVP